MMLWPKAHRLPLMAALLLTLAAELVSARSFRDFNAIPAPSLLPENAVSITPLKPLDQQLIRQGIDEILTAWNRGEIQDVLAEDFVNVQRLADTIITVVPRDARLSLLSLRSHHLLRQYHLKEPGQGSWRVSRVAVTVRLQLTFNDPRTGYQRLPSTSEFILEIREPI